VAERREQNPNMTSFILRGGRLGLGGPPGDVVIADGRVAALTAPGVAEGPGEAVLLPDATVLPGLVDGHVHVDQWAHRTRRIDVSGAGSAVGVAVAVRDQLDPSDPGADGAMVLAHGFVDGLWDDPADKRVLDEVLGPLPAAVVSADMHAVWLSSAGLRAVGLGDHPTGVLREQDGMEVLQGLTAAVPDQVVDRWVAEALAGAAQRGITGLIDFEYADNLAVWPRRAAAHDLAVRVHASLWLPWLDAAIAAGCRTGDVLEGTGGRVQMGPFKLMADGSLNTRTAHCHDRYPEAASEDDAYGLQMIDRDQLVSLMSRAWAAGILPAVHAIGDRANRTVLDAFDAVGCAGRIEHAQLVCDEDLARFARPGLVASVQPQHAVADRDVAERHWRGRTGRAFPYRALYEAGARLEFGSDAPVSPLDPWLAIADAVTRTDDDRPPWHPEQALPLAAAVTAASAGQSALTVGQVADLTVVSGDLERLDPDELRTVPVLATLVGGSFTHRAV